MRYALSVASGVVVALGLFLLMHALIAGTPKIDDSNEGRMSLDFVRVKQDEIQNQKERRKPPEPGANSSPSSMTRKGTCVCSGVPMPEGKRWSRSTWCCM